MKHPSERRPGLRRENPWLFWPRFGWETFAKHAILVGSIVRLAVWQAAIKRTAGAKDYMDQALTPVGDEDETSDLLTKTTGAAAAVAHIRKVAELTRAHRA